MGKSTKPVSPARRKKIIADYAECRNYSEVARRHGLSRNGVKKIVEGDPASAALCQQKAEEQTQDALQYLTSRNAKMYVLVDKLIDAMTDKASNVDMFTQIDQLAKAFGIVSDKLVKLYEMSREQNQQASNGIIDKIIEAVKSVE